MSCAANWSVIQAHKLPDVGEGGAVDGASIGGLFV